MQVGRALLLVTLHVYIAPLKQTWSNHMADANENRQTARPTGGPNPTQLAKAQTKYKVYNKDANTEYERLLPIDAKKKLNPNSSPAEHAIFFLLCSLRDGMLLDFD